MSKFLVTGGAGFIGSHLVDYLVDQGSKVLVIDNLSTGTLSNLEKSIDHIDFYNCSIDEFDLSQFSRVKAVFHLAAQASVPYSIKHFYQSSKSNMTGAFNVIDFCSKNDIPLIYASSSAVYGNSAMGVEADSVETLSPYAMDKFALELYAKLANDLYMLKSFGLRFFNVYGPRQDSSSPYSGVISIFISKMLNEEIITVNDGTQSRDFIFIADVVNGLINAYHYLEKKNQSTICNLLTGKSVTINSLVVELSRIINIAPRIKYCELPIGDPKISMGSDLIMRDILLDREFIDLKSGLKETVEWFRLSKQ